jgi:hypothetical protein
MIQKMYSPPICLPGWRSERPGLARVRGMKSGAGASACPGAAQGFTEVFLKHGSLAGSAGAMVGRDWGLRRLLGLSFAGLYYKEIAGNTT